MAPYLHYVKDYQGFLHELASAIRHQRCALLIGLGLALPFEVDNRLTQSHLNELLRRMVQWALENKKLKKQDISNDHKLEDADKIKNEFDALLDDGNLDKAELKLQEVLDADTHKNCPGNDYDRRYANKIKNEFDTLLDGGNLDRAELKLQEYLDADTRKQCLHDVILQSHQEVRHIHHLLANIPFRAYVTTGIDDFLKEEYETLVDKPFPLLKKCYETDDAIKAYQTDKPFILKLHGDVTKDWQGVLTLSNRLTKKGRPPEAIIYPRRLRELLADLHTLFVGFDMSDPDLEGLKSRVSKKDELKRWLLVPEGHLTEPQAEALFHDYKIITLCYTNRPELAQFLTKLEEVVDTPQEIEVYISYVTEDNDIRNQLQKHLDIMDYSDLNITWSDGKLVAGQVRNLVIEERLKNAQVILLLLSVDYLKLAKSKLNIEMTRAVEREHEGRARVIPIVVRACAWEDTPFLQRLAVLPTSQLSIDEAPNRHRVLVEVAKEIKASIKDWAEQHQDDCPT